MQILTLINVSLIKCRNYATGATADANGAQVQPNLPLKRVISTRVYYLSLSFSTGMYLHGNSFGFAISIRYQKS